MHCADVQYDRYAYHEASTRACMYVLTTLQSTEQSCQEMDSGSDTDPLSGRQCRLGVRGDTGDRGDRGDGRGDMGDKGVRQ